jgi:hypothetical protein
MTTKLRRLVGPVVLLLLFQAPAFAATWRVASSANLTQFDNVLWGADALSPSEAWAVGSADTGSVPTRRPVIERYNGTSWSIASGPIPPGGGELRDVDARASNSVWAVGFTNSSNGFNTLVERFNGSSWNIVPSPNPSVQNVLLGVKAFSDQDVWAVGSHNVPGSLNFASMIQHWNGSSWSVVPSPNPVVFENRLKAIDGTSPNDVWAVGHTQPFEDGVRSPFIVHWNGSSWSAVATPNVRDGSLEGVVAVAPNDVWAVGSKFSLSLLWHVPFALHYDGSTWTEVPMPATSPQGGRLFDVTALSSTKVYAVGQSNASSGAALIMRWNGTSWTVESTGGRSAAGNLWDSAAAAPGSVFAVGNRSRVRRGIPGPSQTFVLQTSNG